MVRRWILFIGVVAALGTEVRAADELPKSDADESFEIEPPLLIPYREPGTPLDPKAAAPASREVDIEQLSKQVERARRSAISAERLFRMGALAKVEAEQRALKAVRLEADLENARLARTKAELTAQEGAGGTGGETKDAELARAIEAAHAATRKREQAELEAAEINLARQQKLLSLGSGHKADVARAERKLAELKAGKN